MLDGATGIGRHESGDRPYVRRHHHWAILAVIAVLLFATAGCLDDAAHSSTVTGVMTPDGVDADAVRKVILDRFDMSLGTGLGKMQGRQFRIGHVGDFNDRMLAAALCGVEMGLGLAGVAHRKGGVDAALEYLAG